MKKLLLCAAAMAALAVASAAQAQDRVCLDSVCDKVSLFGVAADAAAPAGSGWTSTEAPKYGTWGFDTAGMDTSVKPGDSFFRYANGKAMDALVIPSDRSRYGSFDLLRELSDNRLRVLVEKASASGAAADTDQGKIGALYNSYMDEARIQQLDAAPLAKDLNAIRAIKTKADMARSMGATNGVFGASFFNAYVDADGKNPTMNALYLFQGGLGLPDRDYYLKDTFADKKTAYEAYVARMLRQVGWENSTQAAKDIVALETKIAEVSWSRIDRRDDDKTYNPMTVAQLEKYAPGFAWREYLKAASLQKADRAIVSENTAFPKIAKIFADTPIETLRAWQAFHTVDQAAPYLSKRFSDAQWEFRSHTMSGAPQQRARAKRGVSFAEGAMGEALGREYVAEYFPPESKAKMEKLVGDLRSALRTRIETKLAWMSPETKAQALAKLDKFGVKIGYPSKWRDYSGLTVDGSDLYGNVVRSGKFEWAYNVERLGKPVDKEEWGMTPQTVNAYYSSTRNEIVFPAAILQPPFFDPNADMAVNYGGIGGVIGHEIGHGFDDQGRKSDGDGALRDWWTAEDAAKFKAQTDRFGAQYDSYEPIPGSHVQGGLTMGENIGDLAGITLALDAYHVSLNGAESPVLDGITGDQRVFLGWAQVWRGKYRDDAMKQQVVSDPHSPPEFRVIGPMRNIDAWYDAFGVKEGEKYYVKPEDRVRIW
ncbi:M13 family metallopeptidase [Caulobacter sp. 17J80-11]|uniref:M13 family metallopeptidase n=1 Tax=Caulobacter sp. 17J80-11 TaxID=2763502 RepID=UPI00165347BD|nr:M13-type metalloendopeptidase [Caulobacter sp. 17J80-11]MBC6980217.1 peptidase M13 [Caulobacter sp. 17J80-11]